ncbi:hypothetical protein BCR33DRAFT_356479 [Rhizoclosmatium globosum]|uniref:Uncharacterized protein n=1 Tax=Rhizoclosmatium globosum TaxID=329046 RepID=A0A1Y2C0X3_9FUNG|nr:hypothetical protein BCR33DRAFT_356479 [Rhizoclosmatium globosum]|eukprot:ORY40678.1 hypothetical protein BCR33DRAFT_356479 [Rhizoclosmatium globosum]
MRWIGIFSVENMCWRRIFFLLHLPPSSNPPQPNQNKLHHTAMNPPAARNQFISSRWKTTLTHFSFDFLHDRIDETLSAKYLHEFCNTVIIIFTLGTRATANNVNHFPINASSIPTLLTSTITTTTSSPSIANGLTASEP